MPDINPSMPIIGQPNATEEAKVLTALTQLVAAVNDVDSAQILDATIVTADLANNAVTAAKIEAQQAWQTLAISGTGISGNLMYFKDSLGIVHLRGDAFTASVTIPDGTAVGTLPTGYRPGTLQTFVGVARNASVSPSTTGVLTISTGGVLTFTQGAPTSATVTFGGVHFRAEN
jgi:hypothetical protein